jgi:hypothetical protein
MKGLFAVDKQDWMKYLENGEYLRAAEMTEEQNYNMIDGRNNNQGRHPTNEKKEVKSNTKEKTSLLGRLREKQKMLSTVSKKDRMAQGQKKEIDME